MAYAWKRTETVQASQVTGTVTNFPALVSRTHADFKTVGNGGHVQNGSGFDLNLFADSGGSPGALLDQETLKYDATTGEIIKFVRIPSCANGTVIWWQYGDSGVSTSQDNAAGVWPSSHKAVYHFGDGTTLSGTDSTAGGNLTNNSATATSGQVHGAVNISGSQSMSRASAPVTGNTLAVAMWLYCTDDSSARVAWSSMNNAAAGAWFGYYLATQSGSVNFVAVENTFATYGTATKAYSTNAWVRVWAINTNTSSRQVYVNNSAGTVDTTAVTPSNGQDQLAVGCAFHGAVKDNNFAGKIDEVYELDAIPSAAWIEADYNNQSAPTTFWGLGSEIQLVAFDAASNSGYQTAQSTYSWSHTCTGTNRYLAVDVSVLSVPGTTVTSITYNGVAMSLIGARSTVSGAGRVEQWGLVNPATGSNTIAVTLSAAVGSAGTAVSYTGVHQTSPTEAFESAQATNVGAADATVSITTVADNDWVHGAIATDDASVTANQTSRNNVTGALGSGADEDTGPKTPAGAVTISYTGVAALATWAIAGYGIRPVTASTLASGPVSRSRFVRQAVNRASTY